MPLRLFSGFDRVPGISLHILQHGRPALEWPIGFDIDSGNDDVYEAARTVAGLDLIITIDSMPAHLAGALGVPTWVLLHSNCDWRWGCGIEPIHRGTHHAPIFANEPLMIGSR